MNEWPRPSTRRHFLLQSLGVGVALPWAGWGSMRSAPTDPMRWNPRTGFGPLQADPEGILDLPRGFRYTMISRCGERMNDGLLVPDKADGMAAFAGPKGRTVLVRNHEMPLVGRGAFSKSSEVEALGATRVYDAGHRKTPSLGGTTTVVYDPRQQRVEWHGLTLAGTLVNCAGGPTPWGSWLSCEETEEKQSDDLERDHGFVFEVPADARRPVEPVALKGLGRFTHEAVAVDPNTGIVYLTEDRPDGLFYRFLPERKGELVRGGRLQAMKLRDAGDGWDTRNWEQATVPVREPHAVEWIDLEEVEAPHGDLRQRGFEAGAARIARGEGITLGRSGIYLTATTGGKAQLGQVWRYRASAFEGTEEEARQPGQFELFHESGDATLLKRCDNLTIAPWGDLLICEDGPGHDAIKGLTPDGELYPFARNVGSESELAGVTFAPDGATVFFNLQHDGLTCAVTGPWPRP